MGQFAFFDSRVFLAPMAGITDLPMRRLVKRFGAGNMVSEMVAINGLSGKNPKSYRIADVRNEAYPVVVQMVGGNPELFERSASFLVELGAVSLDINMGCPVKKIVANHSGSYLMTDMKLAAEIIRRTVKSVKVPVSVKFRKGWDSGHVNAVDFAKMCEAEGAAYIAVHGRTRSEFYSGCADWKIIENVKAAVNIPVIGNGDVDTPVAAANMINETGADGVMIGRAALGAPWLISQIHNYLEHGREPENVLVSQVKETLLTHLKELNEYYGEKLALPLSRKYVCWYSKNMREAKRFRERYVRVNNWPEAMKEIENFFSFAEQKDGEEK